MVEVSCLHVPQGNYFVNALWLWSKDAYVFLLYFEWKSTLKNTFLLALYDDVDSSVNEDKIITDADALDCADDDDNDIISSVTSILCFLCHDWLMILETHLAILSKTVLILETNRTPKCIHLWHQERQLDYPTLSSHTSCDPFKLDVLGLLIKDGLSFKINKNTYSSLLHSHTVLMKLCPCGTYRQLNLILYPNNHMLESSKRIFKGLVLNEF